MSKWYNQGYKDAKDRRPCDPPYQRGNKHYAAYLEGFADGEREVSENE